MPRMNDATRFWLLIHAVSWPRFNLVTQQNMEPRMSFHLFGSDFRPRAIGQHCSLNRWIQTALFDSR